MNVLSLLIYVNLGFGSAAPLSSRNEGFGSREVPSFDRQSRGRGMNVLSLLIYFDLGFGSVAPSSSRNEGFGSREAPLSFGAQRGGGSAPSYNGPSRTAFSKPMPTFGSNFGGGSNYGRYEDGEGAGFNLKPVDFKSTQLPSLTKNIYNESPIVSERPQSEINEWLNANEVTLIGENIPRPVFEFNESSFPKQIVDLLYRNYEHPTIIQSISWPVALSGRDMISIAKTGSGKTLGVCYSSLLI
jgi:hypothetical protein